jgi:hypothetical protein
MSFRVAFVLLRKMKKRPETTHEKHSSLQHTTNVTLDDGHMDRKK